MSLQMSFPWNPVTPVPGDRSGSPAGPDMRLSDAERSAAADRLAAHYADGRLDRAELDERLDRAMAAKTRSDLSGLFEGLPPAEAAHPATTSPAPSGPMAVAQRRSMRPARPAHRVLMIFVLIAIVAALGQALGQLPVPWLLIGLFVVLWARRRHHRL